jgi:Holliday junction resolvase RusA-like endonuclease
MLVKTDMPLEAEIEMLGKGDVIEITIPGAMRGKGRPRFSARGGFARAYTDEKTRNAETWVKVCAREQYIGPPLAGAIAVTMTVGVAIPASWPKRKQAEALRHTVRPTGKPDLDNTEKLIFDALNGLVWKDDAQVVRVSKAKLYQANPETRLLVEVVG